jgi:N-acetylmuramoyl-L-alanine amidase
VTSTAIRRRVAAATLLAGVVLTGCAPASPTASAPARAAATVASSVSTPSSTPSASRSVRPSPTPTATRSSPATTAPRATAAPRASATRSTTTPSVAALPPSATSGSLAGKVVVIDPGHNGGNAANPGTINKLVWAGTFYKPCDTTGTATNGGYPEYAFTMDVALRLASILRAQGARVVLTRSSSAGVGPCINVRAAIGNQAHADAAISIHADGGPSTGYGFHVIAPGNVGINSAIVKPSYRLALDVRSGYASGTGEHTATYVATNGLTVRTDLGGLNLSTVPKVFIECANMRNAADAARVTSAAFRQRAAVGIAAGITAFLTGH